MHKWVPAAIPIVLALTTVQAKSDPLLTLGIQENGVNDGAITTVASASGSINYVGNYGSFVDNIVAIAPATPTVVFLEPAVFQPATTSSGTETIYLTSSLNTSPLNTAEFASDFVTLSVSPGYTITEQTFVDPNDGIYTLTTPLASDMFSSSGISVQTDLADVGDGPYSVTEVFTVTGSGVGSAAGNITIAPAPVPQVPPLLVPPMLLLFIWLIHYGPGVPRPFSRRTKPGRTA